MLMRLLGLVLLAGLAPAVASESYVDHLARNPDLFHQQTGFRIGWHRSPTPDDIPPPARAIDTDEAAALIATGAVAVDVFGALQSRYDELDGTWLVREPRQSLPGATWLPETGRGVLTREIADYFADNLARLTGDDRSRPLVIFCSADCWMSWNAAQRAAGLGYTSVYWFRDGAEGWEQSGRDLAPVTPIPVNVE